MPRPRRILTEQEKSIIYEFGASRISRNMTIRRAAISLRVSYSLLARVESFKDKPSKKVLEKMAYFLHTKPKTK